MGKAWWQVPDIEKAACRKVWCMFWEAQEKTIANGWYFQVAGFRIHHQEEVSTSQGSNELPGMALSYHGELASRGWTQWGNGRNSISRWGLAARNWIPSNSRILAPEQPQENGAELAGPDISAGHH